MFLLSFYLLSFDTKPMSYKLKILFVGKIKSTPSALISTKENIITISIRWKEGAFRQTL